jgi:hypothetical protein
VAGVVDLMWIYDNSTTAIIYNVTESIMIIIRYSTLLWYVMRCYNLYFLFWYKL